jgi:hypothetical protein
MMMVEHSNFQALPLGCCFSFVSAFLFLFLLLHLHLVVVAMVLFFLVIVVVTMVFIVTIIENGISKHQLSVMPHFHCLPVTNRPHFTTTTSTLVTIVVAVVAANTPILDTLLFYLFLVVSHNCNQGIGSNAKSSRSGSGRKWWYRVDRLGGRSNRPQSPTPVPKMKIVMMIAASSSSAFATDPAAHHIRRSVSPPTL